MSLKIQAERDDMRRISALFVTVILMVPAACYWGLDQVSQSQIACETDEDCVVESDGEYDSCGTEIGHICCGEGSTKCGCHDDGSCEGELECFVFPDDAPGSYPPGNYCLQGWAGDMLGYERYLP